MDLEFRRPRHNIFPCPLVWSESVSIKEEVCVYECMYVCMYVPYRRPTEFYEICRDSLSCPQDGFCQVWCKSIYRDPPHGLLKIPCYSNELLVCLQKTYDRTQNFKTLFYIWLRFDVVPHFSSRLHHKLCVYNEQMTWWSFGFKVK
jgi:hypothetical protein